MSFPQQQGSLTVLQDVSLAVPRGRWATIIGPTGCGKTTILKVAAGLLQPNSGRVLLDGRPTHPLGRVAYMPQADTLLPWRTVLGNALLAADVRSQPRATARAAARSLLGQFGLSPFEHAYPNELSGGMRQRLALIRGFLTGQEVLLLDEPLSALDALSRAEARMWLLDVWHSLGKTILFVTHDVEEAAVLSDHVHLLSSRPARVLDCVDILSDRPRPVLSPQVMQLREDLLSRLRKGAVDG